MNFLLILPPETNHHILRYLPIADLARVEKVSTVARIYVQPIWGKRAKTYGRPTSQRASAKTFLKNLSERMDKIFENLLFPRKYAYYNENKLKLDLEKTISNLARCTFDELHYFLTKDDLDNTQTFHCMFLSLIRQRKIEFLPPSKEKQILLKDPYYTDKAKKHFSSYYVLKLFLKTGIDPNLTIAQFYSTTRTVESSRLILCALNENYYRNAALLLRHGAELSCKDLVNEVPILCALAKYDDVEIMKTLIEREEANFDILQSSANWRFNDFINDYQKRGYRYLSFEKKFIKDLIQEEAFGTPLCIAVSKRNHNVVLFLLAQGANPNIANALGITPLHYACLRNRDEERRLYPSPPASDSDLESDSDVEGRDKVIKEGKLDKIISDPKVLGGDRKLVEILLDNKAAINSQDYFGNTPLTYACGYGEIEIVEILLNRGADPYLGKKNIPIFMALHRPELLEVFIQHGIDINCRNSEGQTLLSRAVVESGEIPLLLSLLKLGASPHIPCNAFHQDAGFYPLHFAAASGKVKIIQILHAHQVDINCRDADGRTPLHLAAANESDPEEIITQLIDCKADYNLPNDKGMTPILLAIYKNNQPAIDLLLQYGAILDKEAGLRAAVRGGNEFMTEKFLQEKVNPYTKKKEEGETLLHMACQSKKISIVKQLLDLGLDSNAFGAKRKTPLAIAAANDELALVTCLLEHGADPNIFYDADASPLEIAIKKGSKEIAALLLQRGAKLDLRHLSASASLCSEIAAALVTAHSGK